MRVVYMYQRFGRLTMYGWHQHAQYAPMPGNQARFYAKTWVNTFFKYYYEVNHLIWRYRWFSNSMHIIVVMYLHYLQSLICIKTLVEQVVSEKA